MVMDNIKTQVRIVAVEPDNQQKCKIDADIPAFESSYDIRFITWWNSQGNPPQIGDTGMAELKPTSRQPYFIKKGVLEDGEPDGSEKMYQLYWDMISFSPETASNGNGGGKPSPAASEAVYGEPRQSSGSVFLDANERYRIDNLMKNARDAIWMVLNHGASGEGGANLYADMESVVKESLVVRNALDRVLESRLGKPVTQLPVIRNSDELAQFTQAQGWKKAEIIQALNDNGYMDSQEYLAVEGNSAMGLAELLVKAFDG
jgi:hypothetical protein